VKMPSFHPMTERLVRSHSPRVLNGIIGDKLNLLVPNIMVLT
jgi:hypothetical protein